MRINITQIMKATNCNENHAINVERYMDQGDMINWSEASTRMINTIARAVSEKLLRDAPAKKKITPKAKSHTTPKAKSKAPVTGSRTAQALAIYTRYEGCTRQEMITYLVSEMVSNHGVELTRNQAAGLYQTCKKKVGA